MASLRRDINRQKKHNGCWTLQFVDANRKRHSIRLGKIKIKAAETLKLRVEAMLEASYATTSLDSETVQWLSKMATTNSVLYDKLAAVGLVAKRRESRLEAFLESYIAGQATNVKSSTVQVYEQTKADLLSYFGGQKPMAEITKGDATDWRTWLAAPKLQGGDLKSGRGLGINTVRKRCGIARQFFRAAIDHKLLDKNPFAGMAVTVRGNSARMRFIPRDVIAKVIAACPDAEWRLIVALSRYGGLRCPSEHLALTWADINWDQERITVRSPKTEHHAGKDFRVIPLFPELRPYLDEVYFDPATDSQFVINRYRSATTNLGTQFKRIIKRAGIVPWPMLFHNLRRSRQNELANDFPQHVACEWIGNSEKVALEHYLTVNDNHFEKALLMCAQQPSVSSSNDPQMAIGENAENSINAEKVLVLSGKSVVREGLEPPTKGL